MNNAGSVSCSYKCIYGRNKNMLSYEEAKQYLGKYVKMQLEDGVKIKGFIIEVEEADPDDEDDFSTLVIGDYEDSTDGFVCALDFIEIIDIIPVSDLHTFKLDNTGIKEFCNKETIDSSFGGYLGKNYFYSSDLPLKLHEAVLYSSKKHDGKTIDGLDISYSLFLMEVLATVCGESPSIQAAIASVLQGTLKEGSTSLLEIKTKFGEDVANLLVEIELIFLEDNHSLFTEQHYKTIIENIKKSSFEIRQIILADFVCVCRHIVISKDQIGDKVWDKFDFSKEDFEFFISDLIDSYYDFMNIESVHNEY